MPLASFGGGALSRRAREPEQGEEVFEFGWAEGLSSVTFPPR